MIRTSLRPSLAACVAGAALLISSATFAQAPAASANRAPAASVADRAPETGTIAYYGRKFAGRKTASGQKYDPSAMTMAHPNLPFGTRVRVTNTVNGQSVVLRVNDRGPTTPGRVADVSLAAASKLGVLKKGLVPARLEVLNVMTSR